MKPLVKALTVAAGSAVLLAGGYIGYLFASYHRLADALPLNVAHAHHHALSTDQVYTAMSYNIGYGSYPPSYSFFMDGGKYSRAYSAQAVEKSLAGVVQTTHQIAPDIAFYQEVDVDGDRSRHVDEVQKLAAGMPEYDRVFAQNYDSAYLFYPFNQPIGAAKSGLVTLAKAPIIKATRYQLPVDTDYNKLMDLDRAFSMSQAKVANGHELVLVNIHLSAFTPNHAVQAAQFAKLFQTIAKSYAQGDYVIVGGDYNHRLIPNAPQVFHTSDAAKTWTHPFPIDQLPAGFSQPTAGLAQAAIPSARGLDRPWDPAHSFKTLIDGFIVSDNVQVHQVQVVDTNFQYSDHNPVKMTFSLN
ncbi:endonuclease/exonuclease/phosphatase family protein [Lacticaseibacillus sp. N501-2]|uniref:endonuclease/exonuclease/phosphatase family protein n=1 Tax=Lacticaseibacillus salsurae TaxID=3367729 RepID=UPI0038B2D1F6